MTFLDVDAQMRDIDKDPVAQVEGLVERTIVGEVGVKNGRQFTEIKDGDVFGDDGHQSGQFRSVKIPGHNQSIGVCLSDRRHKTGHPICSRPAHGPGNFSEGDEDVNIPGEWRG